MVKFLNSGCLTKALRLILCEERKKRRLSQIDLAKKSGLTRQCISLFESGQRVPTFFSMFHLAKGFDISAAKLVSMLMKKMELCQQKELLLAADSKKANWHAN
ncbi:MAG: helix-turn-helix domain-containing protein [Fibromonadales bacterium]|nr:helix-turn-helix domain-containing protein [Fibromonadales bacterium]